MDLVLTAQVVAPLVKAAHPTTVTVITTLSVMCAELDISHLLLLTDGRIAKFAPRATIAVAVLSTRSPQQVPILLVTHSHSQAVVPGTIALTLLEKTKLAVLPVTTKLAQTKASVPKFPKVTTPLLALKLQPLPVTTPHGTIMVKLFARPVSTALRLLPLPSHALREHTLQATQVPLLALNAPTSTTVQLQQRLGFVIMGTLVLLVPQDAQHVNLATTVSQVLRMLAQLTTTRSREPQAALISKMAMKLMLIKQQLVPGAASDTTLTQILASNAGSAPKDTTALIQPKQSSVPPLTTALKAQLVLELLAPTGMTALTTVCVLMVSTLHLTRRIVMIALQE